MAIIDPAGLFNGDRLRMCSDAARLWWPYLFLSANGFGRFELDYRTVVRTVMVDFQTPLSEEAFYELITEYREKHLLFLYETPLGKVWGQWYCKKDCLPRYKTAKDNESPEPPEEEYQSWLSVYVSKNKPVPKGKKLFGNLPKSTEKVLLGVGEGGGVGVGGGKAVGWLEVFIGELAAIYPAKGRVNLTDSSRRYLEHLQPFPDREAEHARIMDRMRAWWVPSRSWATGYVKNLDEFIRNKRWSEEPESADAPSSSPVATTRISRGIEEARKV